MFRASDVVLEASMATEGLIHALKTVYVKGEHAPYFFKPFRPSGYKQATIELQAYKRIIQHRGTDI